MRTEADTGPEALAISVGRSVRAARTRSGMTLVELGKAAGVTQAFLSQLENGHSMPSLLTLHRIAEAFGVSAQALLPGDELDTVSLVRAGEGEQHERAEEPGTMLERFLVRGRRAMEPSEVSAKPGSTSGAYVEHAGEELLYILTGTVRVDLDGSRIEELGAGDCYYYPATVPHRWAVVGRGPARFLVIATPPSF